MLMGRSSCIRRNFVSKWLCLESHPSWRIHFGFIPAGFDRRLALAASFALGVVAIAVVLGAPSPDQWMALLQNARQVFLAFTRN